MGRVRWRRQATDQIFWFYAARPEPPMRAQPSGPTPAAATQPPTVGPVDLHPIKASLHRLARRLAVLVHDGGDLCDVQLAGSGVVLHLRQAAGVGCQEGWEGSEESWL